MKNLANAVEKAETRCFELEKKVDKFKDYYKLVKSSVAMECLVLFFIVFCWNFFFFFTYKCSSAKDNLKHQCSKHMLFYVERKFKIQIQNKRYYIKFIIFLCKIKNFKFLKQLSFQVDLN